MGAPSSAQRAGPALPSYLVLHRAGFALPAASLPPRWALAPPFHPYLRAYHSSTSRRFSSGLSPGSAPPAVSSLWHFPWRFCRSGLHRHRICAPWRYQARRPALRPVGRRVCSVWGGGSTPRTPDTKWCPDFPPDCPRTRKKPKELTSVSRLPKQASDRPAHPHL